MKLLTLSCNECGAPLEVPAEAKYVTCGYCSARLAVQHTASASYTETLQAIGKRTEQIAEDVETLKIQNELERLDREWSDERQTYMTRNKDGSQSVPTAVGSVAAAGLAAVFGLFWVGTAVSMGAPGFFPLFGIVFIVVAIFIGVSGATKAGAHSQALARYESRRSQLVARLRARGEAEHVSDTRES